MVQQAAHLALLGAAIVAALMFALWIVHLLIRNAAIAGYALHRFRKRPSNRGTSYRGGLWSYSRHPNYFFEWLIWVGYAVFALGSPWGWLALICPVLVMYFLLGATGIPATEAQAL